MGLTKRIFIENAPGYENVREAHQQGVREYLSKFTERLPLIKYCTIEGKKRLDRTWKMAVFEAIRELDVECATINKSKYFTSISDRNAVKVLANTKHPELFKRFGLKAPKRCSICGGIMLLKTARRGRTKGNRFWGCKSYPQCSHTEDFQKSLRRKL